MMHDLMSLTFRSAMLIPLLNLRSTSKDVRVLVKRTFTTGLVTTVTPPSIMMKIWTKHWSILKNNNVTC